MRYLTKTLITAALAALTLSCATIPKEEPLPECRISCIYSWVDCIDAGGTKEVCAVLQIKCMDHCD